MAIVDAGNMIVLSGTSQAWTPDLNVPAAITSMWLVGDNGTTPGSTQVALNDTNIYDQVLSATSYIPFEVFNNVHKVELTANAAGARLVINLR